MSVALLAISDGRHAYHARSLASALQHLPKFDQYIFVEDPNHHLGFAGAIAHGWAQIETDHIFHLELDFTFNGPVDVASMVALLERQPHLAQVALKRQPWNEAEKAAGGIVEQHPGDFLEFTDAGAVWTEHRLFFTTNPSVYSSRLCRLGWPQQPCSEGLFTQQLLQSPETQFAYWGRKYDPPRAHHIGDGRAGHGY